MGWGYLLAFFAALRASMARITRLHAANRTLPKIPAARIASISACASWSSALRESMCDVVVIREQVRRCVIRWQQKREHEQRKACSAVRAGACSVQPGECAGDATVVRCVRAVRAAEIVRTRRKCVTPSGLYTITARAPACLVPPFASALQRPSDARRAPFQHRRQRYV